MRLTRRQPVIPAVTATPTVRQMIPPTVSRRYAFRDHMPPTGRHARGREQAQQWKGTSRTVHPAARRRTNRRSWQTELATARRAAIAARLGHHPTLTIIDEAATTGTNPYTHTFTPGTLDDEYLTISTLEEADTAQGTAREPDGAR